METNNDDLRQFTIRGDGGTIPCLPARLTWLKDEFRRITMHAGWSVNDRRLVAEDTRFCRWPGQSTDGRKHSDADQGKPAFPFEGASDVRMRVADEIINEQVILLMASLGRMQVNFTTPDPTKSQLGDRMAVLWEWIRNNQIRREWFFEMRKLAQFRQGDSPGLGILQVWWKQETTTQDLTVTAEDALAAVLEDAQQRQEEVTPDMEQRLQQVFSDPQEQDLLAQILRAHWTELSPARAKQAAKDMQAEQAATFPYPIPRADRPAIRARRLMDDIFIPENTDELQRARVIYVREWFSATELREKERNGEYLPGFVDEVLKHEGESCWRHYTHWHVNGDYSNRIIERSWDKERHRGQYEVLTAFFKASNKNGVPGIYTVAHHFAVEKPGSEMELCTYQHGLQPFIEFPREVLTGKLWDTRGVAELTMTEQQSLKTLHDSFIDHAQLSTVPPIKVPASRPKMALVIGPLKLIKEQRQGEIAFMTPPAYPETNDAANTRIITRLDRFFGRMAQTNSPDWIRAYQQDLFNGFLLDVVEVIRMVLQLAQQYMTDEMLQRVLGEDGLPIAKKIEDIQGQFDLEISFEAGMLSLDYLKAIADLITNYAMKWDKQSQIRSDELENWFFGSISPTLGRRLLQPVKVANQNEVEAAQKDFIKIKAGIEPDRPTTGVDFQTRHDTIMDIGQMNPEAFSSLTPVSKEILQGHLQYLEGQIEQQKNAVIGREMAPRTLPVGAGAGASQ